MKILALETSARACSAAVTEDGQVIASAFQCTGLTHSRTLMPMVEDMLKNAGLTMQDCGAIAVANGPGSFTGIRIGVAAAKGLAFAAGLPAVGVSTLEAMARNAAAPDGLILCAMDARHQQIYNAVFRVQNGVLTRLTPDRPIALAVPHLVQQNAVGVALAAEDILRSGGGGTAQELLPVYLRAVSAQTLKERMANKAN